MTGRFLNHKGVVAESVEVTIARDFRRLDGVEGWRGEAWISTESHVLPGDQLTLEMEGRSTPVRVERVTVDSKAGSMLVRFVGEGPIASN
jgi:hypothetical protein